MLWLVISNNQYYPDAGTGDWRCLTPDRDKALDACRKAFGDSVYLIRIEKDGTYRMEDYR